MSTKRKSLRKQFFYSFVGLSLFIVALSSIVSYMVLRQAVNSYNHSEAQYRANILLGFLDYALSRETVTSEGLRSVLEKKILELADVTKRDLVIYDLGGKFILSNKDANLVGHTQLEKNLLKNILKSESRYEIPGYDTKAKAHFTASFTILKNNMMEPIGILYCPLYQDRDSYWSWLNRSLFWIIGVNLFLLGLVSWIGWRLSENLTKSIARISKRIQEVKLLGKEAEPIVYEGKDEFSTLVKSYNHMLIQLQKQKIQLANQEREQAWRDLAKQVAHEVRNPLSPMLLNIQRFQMKFNPEDPHIHKKLNDLTTGLIEQINTISAVAGAFSDFARMPERQDEPIELKAQMKSILQTLGMPGLVLDFPEADQWVNFDKNYLNRILTNLLKNATEANLSNSNPEIYLILETGVENQVQIRVKDNGEGIAQEEIKRIFEPNFTTKSTGSGLGLAMVRRMVEEYKGVITAYSEGLGSGAEFQVCFPAHIRINEGI